MSQYLDQKFLQPHVEQHGSHMIMTNVVKPLKHKYIHLDTKYRDETTSDSSLIDCNFSLPDRITGIHSATVVSAELPFTFYNLAYQDCSVKPTTNNCFKVDLSGNNEVKHFTIIINPGHITPTNLCDSINAQFSLQTIHVNYFVDSSNTQSTNIFVSNVLSINYDDIVNQYYFTLSAGFKATFTFDVNSAGQPDVLNLKNKLGWVMGFRTPTYTIENTATYGPMVVLTQSPFTTKPIDYNDQDFYSDQPSTNFPYPKYFYIVLEDYSRTPNNSVLAPVAKSYNIPKNIIAKVACDTSVGRGNTIFCTESNGRLLSDKRIYGKCDWQRLRIQLVDDEGTVVDLNGGELSLTLRLEHE